jgi:hypothetical protein
MEVLTLHKEENHSNLRIEVNAGSLFLQELQIEVMKTISISMSIVQWATG